MWIPQESGKVTPCWNLPPYQNAPLGNVGSLGFQGLIEANIKKSPPLLEFHPLLVPCDGNWYSVSLDIADHLSHLLQFPL